MSLVVLCAALALSLVLGIAGLAKLRAPESLVGTLSAFGLSGRLGLVLSRAVPVLEIVLAAALLPTVTRRPSGFLTLGLLASFTAAVFLAVARGRSLSCGCFGSATRSPVSWRTLVRNGVFMGAAGLVALHPTSWGRAAAAADTGVATLVLGLAVAVMGVALVLSVRLQLDLMRRYGEILNRLPVQDHSSDGSARPRPGRGTVAPDLTMVDLNGADQQLAAVWPSHRGTLLIFTDPGCAACEALLPDVAEWALTQPDLAVLVVATQRPRRRRGARPPTPLRWMLDADRAAFSAFGIRTTPSAVLLGPDGRLVAEPAEGQRHARSLLSVATAIGLALADIELMTDDGRPVRLREIVRPGGGVLFWNPECRFCQQLLPGLKELSAAAPAAASPAELAWVLPGPPKAGQGPEVRWPVLFDTDRLAEAAAGVPGTPSLVRLAADGADAEPVVGAAPVLDAVRQLLSDPHSSQPPLSVVGRRP